MNLRTNGVLIDTAAWIDFANNRDRAIGDAVQTLIEQSRAVLCGPVVAELLSGARTEAERQFISDLVAGTQYEELARRHWVGAGDLRAGLLARGHDVPLSDTVVAALALDGGFELLTTDAHFRRIPGIRFHRV